MDRPRLHASLTITTGEARPDAGMAEIRGFSAVMERVKGMDNKPPWLKARN